jgi:uncharacterized Tic20 family protein
MEKQNENNSAFFMHLTSFCGYLFPFGSIIVPLVVWESLKKDSERLDRTGKDVLNFNLSYALYITVLGLIILALGISMIFGHYNHMALFFIISTAILTGALVILKFILIILGSVSAGRGEYYKYPATIHFIN